jgi:predicted DNA repair protein MutK
MAAASLLALLDDISTILDDVAVLTKLATRKTAGVLGDDLALNAQQVAGVRAERELPVVWAVAKGSLVNKAILVPAALAISAFAPWAVTPLLMIGGAFLCYEGFEKVLHRFAGRTEDEAHHRELTVALVDPAKDMVAVEREKIRGAIRTDFILSAEIVVISLGAVAAAPFATRVGVLVSIALLMTVGVYGLVAGIVKLDDVGVGLARRTGAVARAVGAGIVNLAPYLMKTLSFVGTLAMFLVGGSIITHGVSMAHHAIEQWAHGARTLPAVGVVLEALTPTLASLAAGVVAGGMVYAVVHTAGRLRKRMRPAGRS